MRTISLDYETFYSKECSVTDLGYYKYARDPRAVPYLLSVCDGSEVWAGPPADFNFASLEGAELISHNSAFDEEISLAAAERGEFQIPGLQPYDMPNWHCSLNMSAYLWNVRSLAESVKVGLGIDVNKGVRDRAKGKTPEDMKKEGWWDDMITYAKLDAQHCFHLWEKHNSKWPAFERRLSRLTIDQGRYGVRIDVPALRRGIELLSKVIFHATQNLPWIARGNKPASPIGIAEECRLVGIPPPPVKAHDPEAAEAWETEYAPKHKFVLALRNIRKAKKALATLETFSLRLREDDTIAFSLKYAGAHTLRWSGDSGINFQNFGKEPLFIDSEFSFIFDPKQRAALSDQFDNLEVKQAAGTLPSGKTFFDIRGLIIARPGMALAPVDLAQIEPRVLNHLAGNPALLERIRGGMSIYEAHARDSMGWTGGDLKTEDKKKYSLAKARVLGLGYGCGWEKFISLAAIYGIDITEGDEEYARKASVDGKIHRRTKLNGEWHYETAPGFAVVPMWTDWLATHSEVTPEWENCVFTEKVRKNRDGTSRTELVALPVWGMRSRATVAEFRASNPKICQLWKTMEDGLRQSVLDDLVIDGPHGGKMVYAAIREETRRVVDPDTGEEYLKSFFIPKSHGHGKQRFVYGGLLVENSVQWISRMVFAERMLVLHDALRAEDPRQRVLFTVHDEAVPEILIPADPAVRRKEIEEVMSVTPDWLAGCPLGAECKIVERYLK